jgi:hypothetical protein
MQVGFYLISMPDPEFKYGSFHGMWRICRFDFQPIKIIPLIKLQINALEGNMQQVKFRIEQGVQFLFSGFFL